MEQAGIGIVGLVFVGEALQRRYVTAVTVTSNGAAFSVYTLVPFIGDDTRASGQDPSF